jgi:hypothetical protein
MCLKLQMPDGNFAIVCGGHARQKYCTCGRICDFLCDWKVKERKSGTCDRPVCKEHALQVGPDKHLCQEHRKAYADWLKRHPGAVLPPDYQQMSLL